MTWKVWGPRAENLIYLNCIKHTWGFVSLFKQYCLPIRSVRSVYGLTLSIIGISQDKRRPQKSGFIFHRASPNKEIWRTFRSLIGGRHISLEEDCCRGSSYRSLPWCHRFSLGAEWLKKPLFEYKKGAFYTTKRGFLYSKKGLFSLLP